MSSPVDNAMDVKKRRRMQALQEKQKQQPKVKTKTVDLMDCPLGASPKLNPMLRKKGFHSPLSQSRDLDLTKK